MFANRTAAGRELGNALALWKGQHPLVLGLPRGGVVVAREVARHLSGDLDVLLVKKIGTPENPELALGAVIEDGRFLINPEVQLATQAGEAWVEEQRRARMTEMMAQRELYRSTRPPVIVKERVVILVDDGLATGATMMVAVQAVLAEGPRVLVVAAPVGPPETVEKLEGLPGVTAVICLVVTGDFHGVGQFYEDFRQVSDAEVMKILHETTG